jgi:hypothetical protein
MKGAPRIRDVTTTTSPTPKPCRRWLQFSLRTMLVLLLVLGAGLGWLDHKVQQARTQRETAKAIAEAQRVTKKFRELGGSVTIDDKSPSRPVISVSFTSTSVTDAVLEHVTGLTQLQTLEVINYQVTDAGLVHLTGLTRLQTVRLLLVKVTDAGLVHVKGLNQPVQVPSPRLAGTLARRPAWAHAGIRGSFPSPRAAAAVGRTRNGCRRAQRKRVRAAGQRTWCRHFGKSY